MADEFIDIIDEGNEVVGKEMKSVAHEKGLRHRVSAVLVQDKEGKFLITTASDKKVEAGGLYHSAAGHISSGEDYLDAAKRELWEETSLVADRNDFKFLWSFWMEKDYSTRKERERFEVFRLVYSPGMGKIKLNDEHYNEKWLSKDELKQIIQNDPDKYSYPLKMSIERLPADN